MKGMFFIISIIGFVLFSISFVSAVSSQCSVDAQLFSQDPYPSIPGEYTKLVFKVTGLENPACGRVTFELVESFPISLDPGASAKTELRSGTFLRDYPSFALVPYRIRISNDALDGDQLISARLSVSPSGSESVEQKDFTLNVQDVRTDFEVSVKDYTADTKTVVFEILNIGKYSAEALTVEIPKQDGIDVKGTNRNIVGSLDSNEDTTFNFEAVPVDDAGNITIRIIYTDDIGTRRTIDKNITFDSSYFEGRARDAKKSPTTTYVIVAIVILVIIYFVYRR